MLDSLASFGFKLFFSYIGIALIIVVGLLILGALVALFETPNSSPTKKEKLRVKEKGLWHLELEKLKRNPLFVLRDMSIAAILLIVGCIALFFLSSWFGL